MTKKDYRKLMRVLIKDNTDAIRKKAEAVLESGCIDLESHPNNYLLPKAVMCAISREMAFQWRPLTGQYRKEANNIEMFL